MSASRWLAAGIGPVILAWSLWVLWLVLHLLARGLAAANGRLDETSWIGLLAYEVVALVSPTVGAVVASRAPRNPIGWIFGGASVTSAFADFAQNYAVLGLASPSGTLPGAEALAWSVGPITRTSFFVISTFPLLLFPDGRLPSRRWRPVAWLLGIAAALIAVVIALRPEGLVGLGPVVMPNPLAVDAFRGLSDVVLSFTPLGLVVAAASVIVRLRRASGLEREQFKWIAYACGLMIALLGLAGIGTLLHTPVLVYVGFGGVGLPLPIAIGTAIVRYRLYDIDWIINRSLVYTLLTAALAALFAAAGALAQSVLEGLTGQRSDLAAFATVLVVIVAFVPLRNAFQSVIDRFVPGRALLTFLFTDVVGSTDRVREMGDARWREMLERYRATVRGQLARFRGREIDTAGDGFFATFAQPGQAIRCADAIRSATRALGLEARTGLHIGECEVRHGKPSGINVHTAARVMATAEADEILVSSTMRDLVAGSELHFTDRGAHELKGLPGEWRLYAVAV